MKARVGIYSVGLHTYWGQFPELEKRMKMYNAFIAEKVAGFGAEVYNFGLVD